MISLDCLNTLADTYSRLTCGGRFRGICFKPLWAQSIVKPLHLHSIGQFERSSSSTDTLPLTDTRHMKSATMAMRCISAKGLHNFLAIIITPKGESSS